VYKTPNIRRRVVIILALTLAFMAALGGFLFWYLGGQEEAATTEAKKFINAVEQNDASIAPRNGDDYVRGIWRAYRRVDGAELLKTRQKSHRDRNSTSGYSYWVADMLVHTGRGLAVLELSFEPNHLNPKTQVIDLLYELTPDRVPGGVLDDHTLARVKSDQQERGGKPENDITHQESESTPRAKTPKPPAAVPKPPKPKQSPVIKCIRRAHGDVTKIQKCAKLAPS
jgi:hypothetical protein